MLINLIEDYNIKLLATKVYWDDAKERENFKTLLDAYKNIEKLKESNFGEYIKQKEVLFIKEEIRKIGKEKIDYTRLLRYYKRKLVDYGAIREISSKATTKIGTYKKIKKEVEEIQHN